MKHSIPRQIEHDLLEKLQTDNKVILLYGARQVGKTTLIKGILKKSGIQALSLNMEEGKYLDVFSSRDFNAMRSVVSGYELLFLDEAQKVPDIGLNLKILHDAMPHLKIIATGSSSFDLANAISEPLTGRAWSYTLYPIALCELSHERTPFDLRHMLEERLIFGSYPEIFSLENNRLKQEYLHNIFNSYLFKDIFELASIKHSRKIRDLVKLLAFQVGSEVSTHELSTSLAMSRATVEHYIDLLEKSFVVFRLGGFSRNLRKEVTKMDKIYFYDLGIRNAAIDNFNLLDNRDDKGKLWENFLIVERMKYLRYKQVSFSSWFWRTYTGAELDYLEEGNGEMRGYEFKWGEKSASAPKGFMTAYPGSHYECINTEQWLHFITDFSS